MGYALDFTWLYDALSLLANGALMTVFLTVMTAVIGTLLSILGASGRESRFAPVRLMVSTYVELIRNTPFLAQLFFIYFGLPSIGLVLNPVVSAILALTINLAAYGIMIVGAGLDAVSTGQREAGRALGLGPIQIFVKIILPQALKVIFPALTSLFLVNVTMLLQHRGGKTPGRVGLAHPSIAPYGVFRTRDGGEILISIQSDREWRILAKDVLNNATLAEGPEFATNVKRVARRGETDAAVAAVFANIDMNALTALLIEHDIAFVRVNDVAALAAHPHLRQVTVETERGPVEYPAPSHRLTGATAPSRSIPRLGEHTLQIKSQFASDRRKR